MRTVEVLHLTEDRKIWVLAGPAYRPPARRPKPRRVVSKVPPGISKVDWGAFLDAVAVMRDRRDAVLDDRFAVATRQVLAALPQVASRALMETVVRASAATDRLGGPLEALELGQDEHGEWVVASHWEPPPIGWHA